jgi:hypothetical protein
LKTNSPPKYFKKEDIQSSSKLHERFAGLMYLTLLNLSENIDLRVKSTEFIMKKIK